MEGTRFRKFKWFWAWQDLDEEAWLRQMALQGYHLARVVFPTVYEFTYGEPSDVIYRMDYPDVKNKDIPAYLQLFQDADWEHVDEGMGWYYFRKTADPDSTDEILTDAESKVQKYNRLLAFSIVITISLLVVFSRLIRTDGIFTPKLFVLPLLLIWIYIVMRIFNRIQQLKRL
jgi:hypothetical protein